MSVHSKVILDNQLAVSQSMFYFMSVHSKVILDNQLTVNQNNNKCFMSVHSSPSEAVDGLPSDLRHAVDAGRVSVVGG